MRSPILIGQSLPSGLVKLLDRYRFNRLKTYLNVLISEEYTDNDSLRILEWYITAPRGPKKRPHVHFGGWFCIACGTVISIGSKRCHRCAGLERTRLKKLYRKVFLEAKKEGLAESTSHSFFHLEAKSSGHLDGKN